MASSDSIGFSGLCCRHLVFPVLEVSWVDSASRIYGYVDYTVKDISCGSVWYFVVWPASFVGRLVSVVEHGTLVDCTIMA